MPRLSKKYKQEWGFILDHRNRMKYDDLYKERVRECKQSFRAIIIDCPFERKPKKEVMHIGTEKQLNMNTS